MQSVPAHTLVLATVISRTLQDLRARRVLVTTANVPLCFHYFLSFVVISANTLLEQNYNGAW